MPSRSRPNGPTRSPVRSPCAHVAVEERPCRVALAATAATSPEQGGHLRWAQVPGGRGAAPLLTVFRSAVMVTVKIFSTLGEDYWEPIFGT